MSVVVAGGGFKSGFVYGLTDDDGFEPEFGAGPPADILLWAEFYACMPDFVSQRIDSV